MACYISHKLRRVICEILLFSCKTVYPEKQETTLTFLLFSLNFTSLRTQTYFGLRETTAGNTPAFAGYRVSLMKMFLEIRLDFHLKGFLLIGESAWFI